MTSLDGNQETYLNIAESFTPGSLQLNRIIHEIREKTMVALPAIISEFLTACKGRGVLR